LSELPVASADPVMSNWASLHAIFPEDRTCETT